MAAYESIACIESQALLGCVDKAMLYHPDMTLADRIRAARLARGKTQVQVGDKLGVSSQAVGQWESNDPDKGTQPSLDRIPKLARFLEVPVIWLLEGNGPVPAKDCLERLVDELPFEWRSFAEKQIIAILEQAGRPPSTAPTTAIDPNAILAALERLANQGLPSAPKPAADRPQPRDRKHRRQA